MIYNLWVCKYEKYSKHFDWLGGLFLMNIKVNILSNNANTFAKMSTSELWLDFDNIFSLFQFAWNYKFMNREVEMQEISDVTMA